MNAIKLISNSVNIKNVCQQQKRNMFGMLNAIFNKPDDNRIKEVGPDRACAEWLLRCGAHFRWKEFDSFHTDYNSLPASGGPMYKIEEINAVEAALMDIGFKHFRGFEHIRKIRFYKCRYINNDALYQLEYLKDTLEILELTGVYNVTDKGLMSLVQLQLLKQLLIHDVPEVRYPQKVLDTLKQGLPDCEIRYLDIEEAKTKK